jgi:putative molybdopterin biosynthesis protein
MGIEAAAAQLGLHFVPLVREDYFLASAAADLNHPGLKQLREVLAGGAWRSILTSLRGYEPPAVPGSLKRIEQVFPWWPQGR